MSFSSLVARAGSLDSNPLTSDIDITYGGTNWLWVVFAIMLSSNLLVLGWTLTLNPAHRAFHYLSVAILTTASIAYFSLAADLGSTPIRVEFLKGFTLGHNASYPTRSIWYVRYIDWVITTPLLLLELLLVSGLPLSTVFSSIFFDEVMIITGLIGALVSSSYKWGYWAFGTVAMFYIFYVLYVPGLKSAKTLGAEYKKSYLVSTSILVGLWFLYPIAWALAEGSNTISPTGEAIFYGVLDILAKPVFTFVHLYSLRNLDYDLFGLSSGKRSDFVTSSQVEKGAHVHTNEHQKAEHPTTANVVPNHTTAAPVRNSEVTVA